MSKRFLLSLAAIVLAGEAFASGMPPQVTVTSAPVGTQINTLPSSNPAGTSDTVAFPFQGVTGGVPVAVQSGSVVTGQASLTVGSSTGSVALGSVGPVVQVYNPGSAVVYVKLGSSSVTAATTDTPVAAGSYLILNTGGVATYIAAIAPTGTPTLTITTGTGTPLGWGGGGGGGSSAITTWAGGTLGAMANYGTSPGAVLVPGMNAFVTNAVTVTQGTAAGSGPWITTPWIAGAVNSATNGTYVNILQGNAVNASGNPIFAQITAGSAILGKVGIDQTTPGTTNAVSANQGTAAGSGPWITTPWIAGSVNSATNGVYSNILQGNAVLSATNPIFTTGSIAGAAVSATNGGYVNLLQGNAVNASGNPIFAQITAGSAAIGSLTAAETHIGETGNNQIVIKNAMTTSNNTVTTGKSIGGLQTLASAARVSGSLGASGTGGLIQNLTVTFADAVAGTQLDVYYFDANPTGSTCTDNTTFALVTADRDKVIYVVHVGDFTSGGTPVTAQASNLAIAYNLSSATSIYACVVARASFAITSTANASLNTQVLRD